MALAPFPTIPQSGGDAAAAICQAYARQVAAVCGRYISNMADREDVVQETLIQLVAKAETLGRLDRYAACAYVDAAARNTAISFLRRQASKRRQLEAVSLVWPADWEEAADDPHRIVWRREQLRRIWAGLSPAERSLLEGRYVLGYSDEELAAQRRCKASSIRMMLSRVRRKAAGLLEEPEEDAGS